MNEPRSTYDPTLAFPYGEPFYPPSSWTASVYEPYAEMVGAPAPQHELGHDLWAALQDVGHAIERGVSQLPTIGHSMSQAVDQTAQLMQTATKANQASDALTLASEDAKKAFAAAEETAKAVKYIAFGLGGLAALALVVHIVKTTTD